MKNIIYIVGGVLGIEFLLSYIAFPIANMQVFGIALIITAILGLFGFLSYNARKKQENQNGLIYNLMLQNSNERMYNTQVQSEVEIERLHTMESMLLTGARIVALSNGQLALNNNGHNYSVTVDEAKYLLENK